MRRRSLLVFAHGDTLRSQQPFSSARRVGGRIRRPRLSALSWVALHHLVQSAGRHLHGGSADEHSAGIVAVERANGDIGQLHTIGSAVGPPLLAGRLVVLDGGATGSLALQRVGRAPGAGQRPTCQIDDLRPSAAAASARVRLSRTERELMPG